MTTTGMSLYPAVVATRRERALWLTRHGWTAREIARELNVSMRTVERYRSKAAGR
jgi:DNA-binding NarL/FixJ family response regulator